MSTGIPRSNFRLIEKEYEDVIEEIRNGAAGLPSNPPGAIRKTIVFKDLTKLSCQEIISEGIIEFYQYDFYDSDGNIVMKFHSEPHEDKKYQTDTEPFHMHVRKDAYDLKASVRLPNKHFKELVQVINLIIMSPHLHYAFTQQGGNATTVPVKKGKPVKRKR
ncbi:MULTISPECIES: toxin-antitoxin system TumE family protein [Bacillus cereus group]|uniref:toxin-antitoxin system TumE family protein n=1 Tax=Bacillus cereus group TaxID=86661 RepID=UPI0022DED922|nr:DUF6516 family protein [Bacillus cereus group sp. TH152-1LC]MDA1674707.1 DUF6516 family protein [Bacillus cereus group sp. TH152-1LC]